MDKLIRATMDRSRASVIVLLMLWIGGYWAFMTMPKESNPDITIPIIYVSVSHEGIAPEDAERLLARPLEQELRTLEGLKEMRSVAAEGYASVTLEFLAGFDPDQALTDVREKVDTAKAKLPVESDEPRVVEINVSQFPVLNLSLSGPFAEDQLVRIARELKRHIEGIPEVLKVEIGGDREDLLELVADMQVLERYGIDYAQLFSLISNNNRLVAAGNIDTGAGRMVIKVPGVIENLPDLLGMPIKIHEGRVITFGDVATVQRTFKDPGGFARVDGKPAVVLEISKRAGANIIETIETVKAVVKIAEERWPSSLTVTYITDESKQIREMLRDLLNNVLFAVVLVLIVMIAAMGMRPALLVGLTIPGAFLASLLVIQALGFTLNIVVLFSLILVAGMLVDGAIVVAELSDRNLESGMARKEAYAQAAYRMAWPVIASTATTLAVFMPLLFWPGMVGEFMKYLPATVIVCLISSLLMALIFMPVLGGVFGRSKAPVNASNGPSRFTHWYAVALARLLAAPGKTLLMFLALLVLTYVAYGRYNHGVEFFPEVEPDSAQVLVHARGDLSVYEKDAMLQSVEQRLSGMPEVRALYARSFAMADGDMAEDVIGVIRFQLIDWHERRPANRILEDMRSRAQDLPLKLEFRKQEDGPAQGKPVKVRLSGSTEEVEDAVGQLHERLRELGGFIDISDNRPLPGIEWRIEVDREKAARYGVDVATVGNVVQLVTTGLKLADYRPDDAEEEVDIRLRAPLERRTLDALGGQMVSTALGPVPVSNFTRLIPAPKTGTLHRVDGERSLTVEADVAEGVQADERITALKESLAKRPLDDVMVKFAGEDEDQRETMVFLAQAFIIAIMLMALILVVQFNSVYQAALVLSAIVFSTAGVLLGLMITGRPFGIVMVGLGLIALAGIVVNNNIILIDTYNQMRASGASPYEAALETGKVRLRPVLLTAVTTVLGLMPMVLGVNVDLMTPSLGIGGPSTQWWTELSSAIAGGLTFATFLTLLITPCLLVIGEKTGARLRTIWRRKSSRRERDEAELEPPQPVRGHSGAPRPKEEIFGK
ncbi:Cation/multidrug efflux pump [Hahella chejuensis KCTC 2396]|uniref:Cation/multidrug efflux pump n=1 Tax=Hahella chejuensis (strain KCTC 2396) TaxID=349521 RepID=Q2SF27_HAHCH|nr:efflux RND transporter permease subunit [Hahella chejuensis]ABC30747.1 Cation/multidrug efflux pump [Hahella chejuensis KCTC 2396]